MQGVAPQNRHIESLTHAFLSVHWDQKSPLLLGYSGGPDSKALLYALLACGVKPHLAHVDHGWRPESAEEAALLRQEADQLGCPFWTTRLQIEKKEDAARNGRFSYFASLFDAHPYQALLLAHQADDLAETVLKRILEGAHLVHLGGMQPVSQQHNMSIWRPFLKVRRSELLHFLEGKSFFTDSSNSDPAYLRARMRLEIFPFLNQSFGKETTENLLLASERAIELKEYLDRRIQAIPVHKGPWGTVIDLNGIEPLEQRHMLQKWAKLNRSQLQTLLDWLKKGVKSKQLVTQTKKIWVDKGKICLISLSSKGSTSED